MEKHRTAAEFPLQLIYFNLIGGFNSKITYDVIPRHSLRRRVPIETWFVVTSPLVLGLELIQTCYISGLRRGSRIRNDVLENGEAVKRGDLSSARTFLQKPPI